MKLFATIAISFLVVGASAAKTGSPVERVVNLLKDLQNKVLQDGKREQQIYDKYACWCEKTTARKAAAIEQAQEDLRALGQTILKTKGEIATLAAEIAQLEEKIRLNKEAQAAATALREKENGAYMAETTEMKQALAALEKAVLVLKEGTKMGSFLQQGAPAVKNVINALPASANLKPDQMALLGEFAKTGSAGKYAPQSWTVQGILRDMYETFAKDLETATLDEATANRNYELFMHEKWDQLNKLEATKAKKEAAKAEAEALLADTQQVFDATEEQMKADIEFFDATKAACSAKHDEWTNRDQLRAEEIDGIQKALDILTTDDARELFGKSIKAGKEVRADSSYDTRVDITSPVLLQTGSQQDLAAPVANAYKMLKTQATRANSMRLAALAVRVHEAKVGHFDAVLKSIDDMIKTLADEDAADIAKRDQCKDQYQTTDSRIAEITWLIEVNEATIDKLQRIIDKRNEEREKTIQDIKDVRQYMADITAQRKAENADFLQAKKDDTDAINLLVNARDVLAEYYNNANITMGPIQAGVKDLSGTALVQQPDFEISADQAPDADFSGKGHRSKEAKGIVSIMTMIIEDVNEEIMNAMRDEESAQLAFEKQMAAAKKLEADLLQKKIDLENMIAKREKEKADEIILMNNNKADLKAEVDYRTKITPDCNWIIGAFSKRASDRQAEHEGLVKAKEYLAGYQSPAQEASLLEQSNGKRKFDDNALSNIGFLGFRS